MAENEAVAEKTEETAPAYNIQVEDVGPATKKVSVEIPREEIAKKLEGQLADLRREAVLPGFRKGHAPRKLIEKRFGEEIKDEVRRGLISDSYQAAIEKNSLNVIGEPEFEKAEEIKLPDDGPMNYTFQVEVQPEFTVPDLKTIKVKKMKVAVTEAHVDQGMQNLREQQGTLVPVEDRGVVANDRLTADVKLTCEGKDLGHQEDAPVVAQATRIAGLELPDFAKQLEGAKAGEVRTFTVKAPDTFAKVDARGKDVTIEVTVKDIKKLELAEVNKDFLEMLGFENEGELRAALREQIENKVKNDVERSMREQVVAQLLENVKMDLPAKLSARQAEQVVNRRKIDLLMAGVPEAQVEAGVERLKTGAQEEAVKALKTFFILGKLAEDKQIDVSEGELNSRVAAIAMQQGRRPEKLKDEMRKDGSLSEVFIQIREAKAIAKVLEDDAQVEEVDAPAAPEAK